MLNRLTTASQKLSPGLRKIFGNTGWLFVEHISRIGLGIIVGVWVARYLEPEKFGLYSYALAFVTLFKPLAQMGLNGIVVRDLVSNSHDKNTTLGTTFWLYLIGGILTLIFTFAGISLLRPDEKFTHWLVGIIAAGTIFQAFNAIDLWFQAQVQSQYSVIPKSTVAILTGCVKMALIYLHAPLIAFAWAMLTEVVLVGMGLWISYKVNGYSLKHWHWSFRRAKELLKDSWPYILSGIAVTIYMKIDQVMLGQMVGSKSVGLYAAAVKLSEIWYFIPVIVASSVFPAIVRAKERSENEYYQRLQQFYDGMIGISLLTAATITPIASFLIQTILGKEYVSASSILALHIWAFPFVSLGVAGQRWLITENLTLFSFLATILGAISNIILNYAFIPVYGGNGAAIATVIAYLMSSYVAYLVYPPLFRNTKMLTKALLLPFRWRQNIIYWKRLKNFFDF